MTLVQEALTLAASGFHVFPIYPMKKKPPAIDEFPEKATRDVQQITQWWLDNPEYNIGISTTRFRENEALLVVDVDNKGKKKGDEEILRLEFSGFEFPATYTQVTPTGGRHLFYRVPLPVKQGVEVLGKGLDVRSKGGYVVARGSIVSGGNYVGDLAPVVESPAWIVAKCGYSATPTKTETAEIPNVDKDRARERAFFYLNEEAPLAVEGEGGDEVTFRVAARVKDFGVSVERAFELMAAEWNPRCSPPWELSQLKAKVDNAYRYGLHPVGSNSPEALFTPIVEEENLHPFQKLNREYAFVVAGGGSHILWETKDSRENEKLEHLGIQSFHQKLAAQVMDVGGGKNKPVSELWMRSKDRRSFDGICFMPGRESPPRFYNLWRGFAVTPYSPNEEGKPTSQMQESLDAFLDHALSNVCRNDHDLFRWLLGYFAHLVQRPWEKPLTALVFRGRKGVGKNALVDRVGHLLGNHYLLTSNRRYLVGNFNGHLENCLLFALDEAFWSGDKQAEGTLKDLITGGSHVIEHKGKEPYSVENCTRVIIIGNEDWLVPATQDERRFAVFDVGEGRKQDRAYFSAMRKGMEAGGYRLLLRYLLDYDLKGIDVNAAPSTDALMDQKVNSLEPFHQWWLDCLHEGKIVSAEFEGEWPLEIDKERFRGAFRRYIKDRQIRSRIPEDRAVGRLLKTCLPSVDATQKRRDGSVYVNVYRFPDIENSRREWQRFIGHEVQW